MNMVIEVCIKATLGKLQRVMGDFTLVNFEIANNNIFFITEIL